MQICFFRKQQVAMSLFGQGFNNSKPSNSKINPEYIFSILVYDINAFFVILFNGIVSIQQTPHLQKIHT